MFSVVALSLTLFLSLFQSVSAPPSHAGKRFSFRSPTGPKARPFLPGLSFQGPFTEIDSGRTEVLPEGETGFEGPNRIEGSHELQEQAAPETLRFQRGPRLRAESKEGLAQERLDERDASVRSLLEEGISPAGSVADGDRAHAGAVMNALLGRKVLTGAPLSINAISPTGASAESAPANPVRSSLQPLISKLKFVRINRERIREKAQEYKDGKFQPDAWRFPPFPDDVHDADMIQYMFIGNAINFKFWHPFEPGERKQTFITKMNPGDEKPFFGAFAMWASLTRAMKEGVPILDANYLANLTLEDAEQIFRGEPGAGLTNLKARTEFLNEIGQVLLEKYDGSFVNLYRQSGGRAFDGGNGMVERLIRDFPSFRDSASFGRHTLHFNKRAQLAVAMAHSRLAGTGLFEVSDIDALTVFADYINPKGMRHEGVLEYDPKLAHRVDNELPIARGSRMELEIRAATVEAAEIFREELEALGVSANGLNADNFFFRAGMGRGKGKHHLTDTTEY